MFESCDEAALLAQMSAAQRAERTASARRILSAGRLAQLRLAGVATEERAQWCIDNWEAVAAEVGAELGVSRGRASSAMNYGLELLERLPRLGAVFAAGDVDFSVMAAAVFRTGLITDAAVLARIDAELSRRAPRLNGLSRKRLAAVIDAWVVTWDPAALRVARTADRDRHIEFGESRDGMVDFWGALRATDAAVVERRLAQLAAHDAADVSDARTAAQRRADALVALAAGATPAAENPVVIHLLAEAETLAGTSTAPAHLPGYGAVPAAMLRDLAAGARVRPLTPAPLLCAEPRYRPSAALADYIRCRDLHCRFPGCDRPAEVCDIDHTVPWQRGGPTHPANLALLCRPHHLVKTFLGGEKGWRPTQSADGALEWTSPSGRAYRTTPGGALLFPRLTEPAGEVGVPHPPPASAGGTLMMPTRRSSRAAERAARIAWERGLNEARWAADPPPF